MKVRERWPGYAAWRANLDQEIERFRALPRPPGRSFLGPDGRLSQDDLERCYESQDAPFRGERAGERKPKLKV